MPIEPLILLTAGIFVIAVLYSAVGHAGASGYIAVMTLMSLAPEVVRPAALALNILVASIGSWQFARAGHFSWRLFWPFAILAVPAAFVGGGIMLPVRGFRILVGIVLLLSAVRLVLQSAREAPARDRPLAIALPAGAGIGLLSGLTGTGGGIFLTPLLLLTGWANAKRAAAASALFILVNSIAGLAGNLGSLNRVPPFLPALLIAAGAGGAIGAHLGARRLNSTLIRRTLAVVLVVAGLKLVLA